MACETSRKLKIFFNFVDNYFVFFISISTLNCILDTFFRQVLYIIQKENTLYNKVFPAYNLQYAAFTFITFISLPRLSAAKFFRLSNSPTCAAGTACSATAAYSKHAEVREEQQRGKE